MGPHPRAFALAVSLASSVAAAQPSGGRSSDDVALAETLFREAKDLMGDSNYTDACPKLAESQRLDPATGTLLALAVCHEAEGKSATAWAEFVAVATLAEQDRRDDRVRFARERIHALEGTLSRLTITVPSAARVNGLEVKRNGAPVAAAAWGTDTPVDPGLHTIEATAPGKRAWRTSVHVGARADRQHVTVPALRAVSEKPAPQPTPEPETPSPLTPLQIGGAIVGGLGLASLAVGAYFGVQAIDKSDEAKSRCTPELCTDPDAVALNDEAETAANVANVTIAVGLAAVVGGIVMIVVGSNDSSNARLDLSPLGATLRGAF